MARQDRFLRLLLRIIGAAALSGFVAVVMPRSWMNATHQWLGMGPLPTEPIVGYLARSTSAFYALFGGLLLVVSCDLQRYRPVLCYLGAVVIVLGVALFAVDLLEGMPLYWSLMEGPTNTIFGVLILVLSCRIGRAS
ncbi:MAG: hypothetical protein JSW66_15935 [Phycisphaerales bacterium]|nr:MAG: hypothetical protein JSW66_15935 [Phycisphaerales bacterium]